MHHMPDTTTPRHVLMRSKRRRTLNLLVVLAAASLTFAVTLGHVANAPANAQDTDRDCEDFDSQAQAQDALREDPSDPDGLDGSAGENFTGERGVACESLPAPTDTEPVLPANESANESVAPPQSAANADAGAKAEEQPGVRAAGTDGIQAQRTPHTGGPPLIVAALALLWGGAGLWMLGGYLTQQR